MGGSGQIEYFVDYLLHCPQHEVPWNVVNNLSRSIHNICMVLLVSHHSFVNCDGVMFALSAKGLGDNSYLLHSIMPGRDPKWKFSEWWIQIERQSNQVLIWSLQSGVNVFLICTSYLDWFKTYTILNSQWCLLKSRHQGSLFDISLDSGVAFARYLLIGCWKNLIDALSTPLTGRMAGSSKGLAFILGAEGIKEQNQKEKDAICMSLDGLRKAARLSCALGIDTLYTNVGCISEWIFSVGYDPCSVGVRSGKMQWQNCSKAWCRAPHIFIYYFGAVLNCCPKNNSDLLLLRGCC